MKRGERKTETCTNGLRCTLDRGHAGPCLKQRMPNPARDRDELEQERALRLWERLGNR